MRFSIGHRLPFGFYGRAYFGPTYRCRVDSTTMIRGGSALSPDAVRAAFVCGFLAVPFLLILWAFAKQ